MDKRVPSHNRSFHPRGLGQASRFGTGPRWYRGYPLHLLVQPQLHADEPVKGGVGVD